MKEVINIGNRRELFVDDYLIARFQDTWLKLHQPERREVAFLCDARWEDNVAGFNSLVQEKGSVRLYYRASIPDRGNEDEQAIALAESTDGGLHFDRPNLGLVEFEGHKDNNLLQIGGPPHVPPVFRDTNPLCASDARYKGLSSAWRKLYAMASPDGLRWHAMQKEPLDIEGTFDTINTAFWDRNTGNYRSFTRYFENLNTNSTEQDVLGSKPTVVRAIQSSTSQDFIHWTPVVHHQYADGYVDTQLYTNATVPCPGAEHIYLAFPNRYVQERVPNPNHLYPGVNDALFMSSRDCVHWTRYLDAWVRPGNDLMNWTDRNNYPTWGIVQTSDNEWSLYISEHYRHASARPCLRRLAVRPHGFVSLHADYAGGQCITKPLIFNGRELHLNCATSAAGFIKVEIQDETGVPLNGFSLDDAGIYFGDNLDAQMAWRGNADLAHLRGRPVRFRFVMRDADIFALRTAL